MNHLSASELQGLIQGESPTLLDVRETWEFEICHIPGSVNIPMNGIPAQLENLDRQAHIVAICHHGMRSQQIAAFLEANAFAQVSNLEGGVDAWACAVDPKMERY